VTVVWGDAYWDQATALDGGSGLLHRQLRPVRETLALVPLVGTPIWDSEGKYGFRATVLERLLEVRIVYVIVGEFIVLLEVEEIENQSESPREDVE
jgi:hypothetical protein